MIYSFLFPTKLNDSKTSLFLLAARILFGLFFMFHGIEKLLSFEELSSVFPDPIGVGSTLSLSLVIFGELICSLAFIIGILYRLALIPMIVTMCVAVFIIHGQQNFAAKELPVIYLVVFILMYISGPGKYSIDYLLGRKLKRSHK